MENDNPEHKNMKPDNSGKHKYEKEHFRKGQQ